MYTSVTLKATDKSNAEKLYITLRKCYGLFNILYSIMNQVTEHLNGFQAAKIVAGFWPVMVNLIFNKVSVDS